MQYEVNACCNCAVPGYPCRGSSCSLRHAVKYECDICGEDDFNEDSIIHEDDMDICLDCYEKREEP